VIDLRRLRSFVVVAEELHFGRAAQRLHIAQPPLSQQIKLLERDLGAQLFNRNRRRVELTAAGRLLLAHARPLLEQAERVESLVALAGAGKAGFLAIGFVASAAYEAMPAAVRAFRERQPEVELRLEEGHSAELSADLNAGRIDVAFVRRPVVDRRFVVDALADERLVAALPADHPAAGAPALRVGALAGEGFVMVSRLIGAGYRDDVEGVCREAGFVPRVVQEATDMHTIVALVGAGIGVALVPSSVAAVGRAGVAYVPLIDATARLGLDLITRRDDSSPLVGRFREVARDVSAPSSPRPP
jgi:DNA-binding transcriptional LysR family regulator